MMKRMFFAFLLVPAFAAAQDTAEVRRLFESGQYQQIIETTGVDAEPGAIYTAAQSHQKLGDNGQARDKYHQLAGRPEDDAWHYIGVSGQQLLNDEADAASESARQAIALDKDLPEAHYQLGLALAKRQDWKEAASEFDRVTELNPGHAYAHYYGGLMHYRANRPDRMAIHFEQFLKLAPEAPERPEVMQIMRTVRGR
jgi:tetratricopeptide (TPR) repeat protein